MGNIEDSRSVTISHLMSVSKNVISNSIAISSKERYTSCFSSYLEFCKNLNLQVFPLCQENMILFASKLGLSTSHNNINVHLAAIKFFAQVNGFSDNITSCNRLYRLIRGIKHAQAGKFGKPKRLPITPALLRSLCSNMWNSSTIYEDKLMLWAAMLTAFFGFLRVSEYTSDHVKAFDPVRTLCCQDISIIDTSPRAIDLQIKASKCDPFRSGITVRLTENKSLLCPVNALKEFSKVHPSKKGPLFAFQDGRYLTRKSWSTLLSKFKPAHLKNLSSHSFRIGAATTAAAAGYPRWLIQALGRWSSDCFRDYLRVTDHTRNLISRSMASIKVSHSVTYDPDNY